MKLNRTIGLITVGLITALGLAPTAWADNVAHCEVLLMQVMENEAGTGEAQIASYRPAVNFLASLYDEEDGHMTEVDEHPIRAVMCRRNDVIPAKTDYPILATGLPFILSQDFDRPDTDSLTMFWKDGAIDYVYKGYPLSKEGQKTLDNRLVKFSERGLNAWVLEAVETKTESQAEGKVMDKVETSTEVETSDEIKENLENDPINEGKE